MSALYGHGATITNLEHLLGHKRLGQAYIFSGPKGIGKATTAFAFAFAHISESKVMAWAPRDPLVQRMKAGTCGNFRILRPDATSKSGDISLESVRQAMDLFRASSFEGGKRVLIIDSVDTITRQGANALLKLLEEPPRGALFILISHLPGKVLPTLASRCQRISFAPLGESHLEKLCQERNWPRAYIPYAQGSAGFLEKLHFFCAHDLELLLMHLEQGAPFSTLFSLCSRMVKNSDDPPMAMETLYVLLSTWTARHLKNHAPKNQGIKKGRDQIEAWFHLSKLFQEGQQRFLDHRQTLALALCQIQEMQRNHAKG